MAPKKKSSGSSDPAPKRAKSDEPAVQTYENGIVRCIVVENFSACASSSRLALRVAAQTP